MAKSSLDCRPAKSRNLELDFLRLLLAVTRARAAGDLAQGYLLVLHPTLARRIEAWQKKYGAEGAVTILKPPVSPEQAELLASEKRANARGMAVAYTNEFGSENSSAAYGQRLGESLLREQMCVLEPGVTESSTSAPLGVRWDFFGVGESGGV